MLNFVAHVRSAGKKKKHTSLLLGRGSGAIGCDFWRLCGKRDRRDPDPDDTPRLRRRRVVRTAGGAHACERARARLAAATRRKVNISLCFRTEHEARTCTVRLSLRKTKVAFFCHYPSINFKLDNLSQVWSCWRLKFLRKFFQRS